MRVDCDTADIGELTRCGALLAPGGHEFPALVELCNPSIAETIGDKYVSGRVPSDISRTVEQVSGLSRAVPSSPRARRNIDILRFTSEQHRDASLRIELHDHSGHLVHHPNVVAGVDPDLRGNHEAIGILADLTDVFSGAVELE